MQRSTTRRAHWGVLLVLLGAGTALAVEKAREYYSLLPGSPATYRATLTAQDSADASTVIDTERTKGNPTLAITASFSTAGATATVDVLGYFGSTPVCVIEEGLTISATRYTDSGGRFLGTLVLSELPALPRYEVRLDSVSAGNVSLVTWVYGADSAGSE